MSWDYNDKKIWANSEVLQELEKRMLKAAAELERKIEAQQAGGISQKIKEVNDQVNTAQQGLGKLMETTKNLADDEVDENMEATEADEDLPLEISEEEHAAAKAALLEELHGLAVQAADQGDKKLAYKIERTIDEITYEN